MFKITPLGDSAIQIQFDQEINKAAFDQVQSFYAKVLEAQDRNILDAVPAYTSVTVFYRPTVSYRQMAEWALQLYNRGFLTTNKISHSKIVEIPVCYGGKFGPDINYIASYHRLSVDQVIYIHTAPLYLVYMLGFMPGFPYLGGLDQQLATPRLSNPRSLVPHGSVGIAGGQTGLYPLDSPGGWQLIGRSPKKLFNVLIDPPAILQSGDYVRFVAINEDEFWKIKESSA